MTITELIAQLEQLKAVHGDLKVAYRDTYEGGFCNIDSVGPSYSYKIGEWGVEDKTQPAWQIYLI